MISEQDRQEIDRVNQILCDHFGITVDDMKARNKNRLCASVKSYAIYYLHTQKGMSATTLSRAYKLHRRVVFNHVAKIKGYIEIYSTTRKEYEEVCALLGKIQ